MRSAHLLLRQLRAARPPPSLAPASARSLPTGRPLAHAAVRSTCPPTPTLRAAPARPPLTLRAARRRPYSTHPPPPTTPHAAAPDRALSLSQRLRKLSREYGWAAFGVYMALSALDFPFCFLAVRWLGTERIGRAEQAATAWVQRALPVQIPEPWRAWWRENVGRRWRERTAETGELAGADVAVEGKGPAARVGYDHGVREAEAANRGEGASIWTQLALAYAIHKSFIFLRVPLAAAVTPKVVRTLRGWGWNIGKRRPRAEREAARAAKAAARARKG